MDQGIILFQQVVADRHRQTGTEFLRQRCDHRFERGGVHVARRRVHQIAYHGHGVGLARQRFTGLAARDHEFRRFRLVFQVAVEAVGTVTPACGDRCDRQAAIVDDLVDPFGQLRRQGRDGEGIIACAEAGIPVTVVPGVTSAIAVPALAGVPVTHRGVNHEFVVVSGHLAPDAPESLVNWDALAAMTGTIVLLMAVERIELFAAALQKGGRPADTPVLVVQQGSTAGQRTVRATLADVATVIRSEGVRPPAIIVIGPVVEVADAVGGR